MGEKEVTYTICDLDKVIEDYNGEWGGSWDDFKEDVECNSSVDIPGIGQARYVDGHRDGGEDGYYFVFAVIDSEGNGRLFKRCGWYVSHSGGELDGPTYEVKPRQKTITVYDAI